MSKVMHGLNSKIVRTSIAVSDLLHHFFHVSFGNDSFLLKLLLLIHFSDLSHLFLQ